MDEKGSLFLACHTHSRRARVIGTASWSNGHLTWTVRSVLNMRMCGLPATASHRLSGDTRIRFIGCAIRSSSQLLQRAKRSPGGFHSREMEDGKREGMRYGGPMCERLDREGPWRALAAEASPSRGTGSSCSTCRCAPPRICNSVQGLRAQSCGSWRR